MGKHSKHEKVETKDVKEEKVSKEMGIHTIQKSFEREIKETITKVVDGSLRSGKRVEYEGSIVVLGDINNGAEVIAEDNIMVIGKIRGLAHAGAKGNRQAIIVANEIDAPQIRIADIVKEMDNPTYNLISDEEDEENHDDKKAKYDDDEEEEYYEDIKTRAYIKGDEIILE